MAYRIGRGPVPEFRARKRASWDDRRAAVSQLIRLAGEAARPDAVHLAAVADRYHVDVRSVQRWWADPRLRRDEAPERDCFTITDEHLTVIASYGNYQDAYDHLDSTGQVSVSRSTFYRALLHRTDPGLVAAAREGEPGLRRYRLHMRYSPPHVNHTWHIDATQADLYTWLSHKESYPVRPWIYVCVDGATGFTGLFPFKERPNAEAVAAALTEMSLERFVRGVRVGGIPEQIVCDNAAEHFAGTIQNAALQLGWVFAPTTPYSPWQNGKAERALGLMNQKLAAKLPGALHAGVRRDGTPRQVAKLPADIKPGDVLAWHSFCVLLRLFNEQLNTHYRVKRLGGRTRLEALAQDATPRRFLSEQQVRAAMMLAARPHACNKDGFSFRGHVYTPVPESTGRENDMSNKGFRVGDYYQIRYLPTQEAFIEVYDEQGRYVGMAVQSHLMSKEQKDLLMLDRARQERVTRAVESGAIEHGRHLAAAVNEQYGHEVNDYDELDAMLSALADPAYDGPERNDATSDDGATQAAGPALEDDGGASAESTPASGTRPVDAPGSSSEGAGDQPAAGTPTTPVPSQPRPRRRSSPPAVHGSGQAPARPSLPRVPVAGGRTVDPATQKRTVDRLAAGMEGLFDDEPSDGRGDTS